MDVSTILFRTLDEICWTLIEDPRSPYEVAGFAFQCRTYFGQMVNGFIVCRKHNPFIKRCRFFRRCFCLLFLSLESIARSS